MAADLHIENLKKHNLTAVSGKTHILQGAIDSSFGEFSGDTSVQAISTDPSATLTVVGYGEMKNNGDGTYQFRLRGAIDPGGTITITSSSGGSATDL